MYLPASPAVRLTTIHLTSAWGVRGAYNHNWDPYWSTSLFGSYAGVRYDDTAKFFICSTFTAARAAVHSGDYSCNPDFNVAQVGLVTRWTPVKNLTFWAEVSGPTSTRSSRVRPS